METNESFNRMKRKFRDVVQSREKWTTRCQLLEKENETLRNKMASMEKQMLGMVKQQELEKMKWLKEAASFERSKQRLLDKVGAAEALSEQKVQSLMNVHTKTVDKMNARHTRSLLSAQAATDKVKAQMEKVLDRVRGERNAELNQILVEHESQLNAKDSDLKEVQRQIFSDKKAVNNVSFLFIHAPILQNLNLLFFSAWSCLQILDQRLKEVKRLEETSATAMKDAVRDAKSAERDSAKRLQAELKVTDKKLEVAKKQHKASIKRVIADNDAKHSRTMRDLKRQHKNAMKSREIEVGQLKQKLTSSEEKARALFNEKNVMEEKLSRQEVEFVSRRRDINRANADALNERTMLAYERKRKHRAKLKKTREEKQCLEISLKQVRKECRDEKRRKKELKREARKSSKAQKRSIEELKQALSELEDNLHDRDVEW